MSRKSREIIGVAPTGAEVYFPSLTAASKALGAKPSSLSQCIHGRITYTRGWRFRKYNGEPLDTFAELTPELRATSQPAKRMKGIDHAAGVKPHGWGEYIAQRAERKHEALKERDEKKKHAGGERPQDAVINAALADGASIADLPVCANAFRRRPSEPAHYGDYKERMLEDMERAHRKSIEAGPHTWGFYVAEFATAICPVCGAVLPNVLSSAWQHIKDELAGRDYAVCPGGRIIVATQSDNA